MADLPVTPQENASLAISAVFYDSGTGYMLEQGTKPGTISMALGTNPLALLSWYEACSLSPDCPTHHVANSCVGLAVDYPRAPMPYPSPQFLNKSRGIGSPNPTADLSGPIAPRGPLFSGIATKVFPLH